MVGLTPEAEWARSGVVTLTGDVEGPALLPPGAAAAMVEAEAAAFGLDARVLSERAALMGLHRNGRTSCGGASCLLEVCDGWVVLSLARGSDIELVPALIGGEKVPSGSPWDAVVEFARTVSAAEFVERAAVLDLPGAVVDASPAPSDVEPGEFTVSRRDSARSRPVAGAGAAPDGPLVVDLSALWAGPLCSHLLQRRGARVIRVEAVSRPDGARRGNRSFFDLLNAGKQSVAFDFDSPEDRRRLRGLIDAADVVISSARRRAIEGLGLDVGAFLAGGGTDRVWVAITGFGWNSNRVAFGDDAAAAAGLVAWGDDGAPRFVGDAIADPLTGVFAAAETQRCWEAGGRWFIDASLVGAATRTLRDVEPGQPARPATEGVDGTWRIDGAVLAEPRPREALGRAACLGEHNAVVMSEFGL